MIQKPVLIILALSLITCSKDKIIISGTIRNADTLTVYLDEVDLYESMALDSAILKKRGSFRFTFRTASPGFYQLRLSNNKNIVLFPRPGQQIHIEADATNFIPSLQIEGSEDTEQVLKVVRNLNGTKAKLDSLTAVFNRAEADSTKQRLNKEFEAVMESHRKFSIAFLLTHFNSFASLYVLYQQYQPGSYVFYRNTDLQYFKIVSDSLKKYYPDSRHVIALDKTTQRLIGDYNASLVLRLAEGAESTLPEVALPGIAGDTITLKSMKGPYVLLYFWASWSPESISQNRQLIQVYNNFRSKGFDILAVSLDNSTDSWTRTVKFDELYWTNVIDITYPNSITASIYNVTSLPCNYLIDINNVTILGKNLTPAQLQMRLSELLN
ncbi:MAG: AhpC/TSA family protein [Bacteroidales bacterium]|nr:AhpC/TSA family protein [Bacteroidales bacterium]